MQLISELGIGTGNVRRWLRIALVWNAQQVRSQPPLFAQWIYADVLPRDSSDILWSSAPPNFFYQHFEASTFKLTHY